MMKEEEAVIEEEEVEAVLDGGGDDPHTQANPIHSTDGAREMGYGAALVGGVSVYGWCVPAIVRALGEAWLSSGYCDISFRRPVHPAEIVLVRILAPTAANGPHRLRVIKKATGVVACDGIVGVGTAPFFADLQPSRRTANAFLAQTNNRLVPVSVAEGIVLPPAGTPAQRALVGRDLPPIRNLTAAADLEEWYASRIHPRHRAAFDASGILHPAVFVAGRGTPLLHHGFDYTVSIHTRTRIQHLSRPVAAAAACVVAGHVVAVEEKKGKEYVTIHLSVFDEKDFREIARLEHIEIIRLPPAPAPKL